MTQIDLPQTTIHHPSRDKHLWIIYTLSFIGDLTSAIIILCSVLLATGMGADTVQVGWVGGMVGLTYAIMPVILGPISERLSRKHNLMIGTAGQFLIALYYVFFVSEPWHLIVGSAMWGTIMIFYWISIEAYISEHTDHSEEAHKTGFLNYCLFWTTGSAIAAPIGGGISEINPIYSFLLVFVIDLSAFIIVAFFLPNKPPEKKTQKEANTQEQSPQTTIPESEQGRESQPLNTAIENNTLERVKRLTLLLLVMITINAMVVKIVLTYHPNYAKDTLGWSDGLIGTVGLFFGVGRVVFFTIAKGYWYIKKHHLESGYKVLPQSLFIMSILLVTLRFATDPVIIGIIFGLSGFFVGRSYVTALDLMLINEKEAKGTKAGMFEGFIGIGLALTPIISGWLAQTSPTLPFLIFAGLALIITSVLEINQRKYHF